MSAGFYRYRTAIFTFEEERLSGFSRTAHFVHRGDIVQTAVQHDVSNFVGVLDVRQNVDRLPFAFQDYSQESPVKRSLKLGASACLSSGTLESRWELIDRRSSPHSLQRYRDLAVYRFAEYLDGVCAYPRSTRVP